MRKKSIRHKEIALDDRLLEPWKDLYTKIKGNRSRDFFANNNPITLEIACWKWEYCVWMSAIYPERNFVWIDKKWERMWYGLQKIKEKGGANVGFLRAIVQNLSDFFDEWEVEEIWIVHPDPRPKGVDTRRRLTYKRFLQIYKTLLKPWGMLKLKTDDTDLFERSQQSLAQDWWELQRMTKDLYQSDLLGEHHWIETFYEKTFVAAWRTIKYGVWSRPDDE